MQPPHVTEVLAADSFPMSCGRVEICILKKFPFGRKSFNVGRGRYLSRVLYFVKLASCCAVADIDGPAFAVTQPAGHGSEIGVPGPESAVDTLPERDSPKLRRSMG